MLKHENWLRTFGLLPLKNSRLSKLIPDLHRMLVTCSHKIYEVQE